MYFKLNKYFLFQNGALKIIDRRKQIFKLSQGEYIAPEKIENILKRSAFIDQVYVDGDSLQVFTKAISRLKFFLNSPCGYFRATSSVSWF